MPRTTHTYALLELSPAAHEEIARKLREAGYGHAFHDDGCGRVMIDMSGVAVVPERAPEPSPSPCCWACGGRLLATTEQTTAGTSTVVFCERRQMTGCP